MDCKNKFLKMHINSCCSTHVKLSKMDDLFTLKEFMIIVLIIINAIGGIVRLKSNHEETRNLN